MSGILSPYNNLPDRAFWKKGVEQQHPLRPTDLYRKKFNIGEKDRIATAGSCFAQHIARHMRTSGFTVLDMEPPPPDVPTAELPLYGYGLYSARFGNIYTSRQLLQLAQEAFGLFTPQNCIWEKGGRFYDALRPGVEPNGLGSAKEVQLHRSLHLKNVAKMLDKATVFVFTLGLTETWEDVASGTIYPTAPGTIAGSYDPSVTRFKNLTYTEVYLDLIEFRRLVMKRNPDIRFIFTVSPVPLTATASNHHVWPASVYSKSVLRAVAGELQNNTENIDYFPSYEIIGTHPSKGFFFENNLRSVNDGGVEVVMNTFFEQHKPISAKAPPPPKKTKADVVCEEVLLEAFAR